MHSDQNIRRVLTHRYVKFICSRSDYRGGPWVNGLNIAFTQSVDAWQRYACNVPVANPADVARFLDAADLDQLGLRPVTEGGKLWLHVPDDEGLLTETQASGPLNLATDAQIYLDLQRTGLRGPDAATALREWEGFCRSEIRE